MWSAVCVQVYHCKFEAWTTTFLLVLFFGLALFFTGIFGWERPHQTSLFQPSWGVSREALQQWLALVSRLARMALTLAVARVFNRVSALLQHRVVASIQSDEHFTICFWFFIHRNDWKHFRCSRNRVFKRAFGFKVLTHPAISTARSKLHYSCSQISGNFDSCQKNVICKFGVPNWQQSHDINVFWTKHINLTRDSTGGVASHLGRPHMRHRLERHDCEYQSCRVGMEGSEVLTTLQGCKFPKQFVQESPTSQVYTSLLLYQDA